MSKVENLAADLFLQNLPSGEEAATAPSSQEAPDDVELDSRSEMRSGALWRF